MKKLILIILLLLICGCGNKFFNYKKLMEENEHIIIDVRSKEEYDLGHIKNSINIPYDEIDSSLDLDKEKLIFVYCKSGNRSKIAYESLIQLGYEVYDLGAFTKIDLPREM